MLRTPGEMGQDYLGASPAKVRTGGGPLPIDCQDYCISESPPTWRFTLQTSVKSMFISPNYLGRIFREEMGCKFSDWLNLITASTALMELIKNSLRMRTMDIAEAVGFGNYEYFQCV